MATVKNGRSTALSVFIRSALSLFFIFLYFWFDLPPINLRSPQFWAFAVICMIVVTVIFSIGGLLR